MIFHRFSSLLLGLLVILWSSTPNALYALNQADLLKLNTTKNCPHCDLAGAQLTRAQLTRANLTGANLMGANLRAATLFHANLIGANLSNADLSVADLSVANLSGANLSFSSLREASLQDAEMEGVNLTGADLQGARLIGANLTGANLERARLSGANLSLASLSNANLTHTTLTGVKLSNTTWVDRTRCEAGAIETCKPQQYGQGLGREKRLSEEKQQSGQTGGPQKVEHLKVVAILNKTIPVQLLVDTGASYIVLSKKIGKKLETDNHDKNEIITLHLGDGRKIFARYISLDSVSVQGVEAINVGAAVLLDDRIDGISLDGMLGMSFLNRFNFTVDRNKNQIFFENPK